MVQLIIGNKGKGKTKHLLDKVNARVKEISGNIESMNVWYKNISK